MHQEDVEPLKLLLLISSSAYAVELTLLHRAIPLVDIHEDC